MNLRLFLLLALVFPSLALTQEVPSEETLREVANSKAWHRLLHYRRSFPLYPLRSELDGVGFFFSPKGDRDPYRELTATITALKDPAPKFGALQQAAVCSFPARRNFLEKVLGTKFPDADCAKLDEFMKRFNPQSLTLVFSTAFPNNPASMFGHTFLRVNSKAGAQDKKRKDLLDFGLGYAAVVPPEENTALYMALGLAGGYAGQFSMDEYFKKVNEYTNGESRDLWEYDLSLTEEETRTVLLHAWEIETNSHFNYYFFDENCSYEILTLLEVARPEWDISQFAIYVIPAETVKRVSSIPGAITKIRFRPSLRRKMMERFDRLSSDEKKRAFQVVNREIPPTAVNQPETIEAATSYLFYRQKEKQAAFSAEDKALLAEVLIRRSELPTLTEPDEPALDRFSQPERGHYPYRLGVAYGRQEKDEGRNAGNFADFRFKFAYHDLLNSDVGYIPYSQVDFPGFILRRDLEKREFHLEEIHFLSITSLFPLSFIEKKASWLLRSYSRSPLDRECNDCKALHLEGGLGAAVEPAGRRWILYSFLVPAVEVSGRFDHDYRLVPYLQLGTIVTPRDFWKIQLTFDAVRDVFQDERQKAFSRVELGQSFAFNPSWDFRMTGRWIIPGKESATRNHELALNLNYYFP